MPSPYDNLRFAQTQYIPQYQGAPVEEFGNLLAKRETDYKQNITDFDQIELAAANLDVNEADYTVKKQAVDRVRASIQEIADTGGAYEFAATQVRQVAKDFTGNQGLKTAIENQSTIKTRKQELQNQYIGNKISKTGFDHAMSKLGEYGGVGEGQDGIFQKPEIYDPVKFTDVGEKLNKFGQGWKASSTNSGWYQGNDGYFYKDSNTKVDEDEVKQAMYNWARGDADIMATVNEYSEFGPTDENGEPINMLDNLVNAQMDKIGFSNYDRDMKVDSYALADYKNRSSGTGPSGGPPIDVLTRIEGHQFKTSKDAKNTKTELLGQKAELMTKRKNIEQGTSPNKETQIAKIDEDVKALEQREAELDIYHNNIVAQVLKERNLAPDYVHNPNSEDISKAETITEANFARGNYTTPDGYYDLNLEDQFKADSVIRSKLFEDALKEADPYLARIEEVYRERGEDKFMPVGIIGAADTKEFTFMDNYGKSAIADFNIKGETIGEEGARGLGVGLSWLGTKGGIQLRSKEIENISDITYAGTIQDPKTGQFKYAFNTEGKDGSRGYVTMGGQQVNQYLAARNPNGMGGILATRLPAIRNSISGEGEITVKNGETVKIKTFHNNPNATYLYEVTPKVSGEDGTLVEGDPISFQTREDLTRWLSGYYISIK